MQEENIRKQLLFKLKQLDCVQELRKSNITPKNMIKNIDTSCVFHHVVFDKHNEKNHDLFYAVKKMINKMVIIKWKRTFS
jgi:hypothetical protein